MKFEGNIATGFLFVMAGLAGLLYGIDIGVITAALPYIRAATAFSDAQLSLVVGAVVMGAVGSALFAGPLADRIGRKPTILLSAAAFTLSIPVICLSGGDFATMMAGRVIQGVSQGLISVVMPMYLAEMLPAAKRGKGTGFFQLMLSIGLVAVALLGFAIASMTGDATAAADVVSVTAKTRAWQLNFWIAGVPGVLLLVGSFFLEESPGRHAASVQAVETMGRAGGSDSIFRRRYLIPFAIAFVIVLCTQATGTTAILNYSVTILSDVGLSGAYANMADTVVKAVNLVATLAAISLVDVRGRRFLLKIGTLGIVAAHLVSAGVFSALRLGWASPSPLTGAMMAFAFVLLVGFYAIGPGVCVWLVMAELMPTRIRANGMSVSLFCNRCMAMGIASLFLPWANAWGFEWVFLSFAACTAIYFLTVNFFLPETKGKALDEIERMFESKEYKI